MNVGLSVSRVGGDAQTKAMKKAVGTLRLDLAQFREMEVFTQFSSDLDDATRDQLEYGQGLMQMLIQPQYNPYSQHQMVVMLVSALSHAMQKIRQDDIHRFLTELTADFENMHEEISRKIAAEGDFSDADKDTIVRFAKEFAEKFYV